MDNLNKTSTSESQASDQLENAFLMFNELSEKLANSYSELEDQVANLSGELAEARNERLRQLAEKEILAKRLEGLLDALPAGVVVLDSNGTIRQCNPLALDMLGVEITGQSWYQVAQQTFVTDGDELRLRDGRWVSVSVQPLAAEPGKIILLADISETHRLQSMLNRQQRLTSLGEMIASLAHQLRTPLASALLYLSTMSHPASSEQDRKRFIDKAKNRLHHLERMVNDMLLFARGDVYASENIDVFSLLSQLESNITEQFQKSTIALKVDNKLHAKLCANHDILLSALQNLADNALEACIEKQQTESCQLNPGLHIDCSQHDNHIVIHFSDSGCGMPESIIDRIMEPFFTTRNNGTGLGLAVVNAIVEGLQGKLKIYSKQGMGTNIQVVLPIQQHNQMLSSELAMNAANMETDKSLTNQSTHLKEVTL